MNIKSVEFDQYGRVTRIEYVDGASAEQVTQDIEKINGDSDHSERINISDALRKSMTLGTLWETQE